MVGQIQQGNTQSSTVALLAATVVVSFVSLDIQPVFASPTSIACDAAQCRAQRIQQPKEIADTIRELQVPLSRNIGAGRIGKCSILTKEYWGQGFTAWGGLCNVSFGSKKSQWLLCADDGLGNFVAEIGGSVDEKPAFVASFVHKNCATG